MQQRDNFKAGLFVLAGIALATLAIVLLSDLEGMLEAKQDVEVRFPLHMGLRGLKNGATVTLGDQPIGSVVDIRDEIQTTELGTRVVGKVVTLAIPERMAIYEDADIELSVPTIGTGTKLNIRSVGSEHPYEATSDAPITGSVGDSPLLAGAGIEEKQREQIQRIIANVEETTTRLKDDLPAMTQDVRDRIASFSEKAEERLARLDPILADAQAGMADARAVTADVRERSATWFDRADTITADVSSTTDRVNTFTADKDPVLREVVDDTRDVMAEFKKTNMPQIDEAMTKVNDVLDRTQPALEDIRVSLAETRAMVVGQRPNLERMIANLSLTASQLKLAAIEVRRSPWRLLYQPTEVELETDNVYDAARSFAMAAETLESTAATLNALAADDDVKPQQMEVMLNYLNSVFGEFQAAEKSFWNALGGDETTRQR